MVLIQVVFWSQNRRTRQIKWIGVAQSLVPKRYARVFSQRDAEVMVAQLQRLDRFRRAVMTLETAMVGIMAEGYHGEPFS
ncbi:hypothetical protein Hgul01_04841 [Herpetosiphon gulosus]|uniref:Transposase n=2 Tax=Herpetosiphon gulosus TaxID=1973496 RepID=A0ABP9X6K3_9CHLR